MRCSRRSGAGSSPAPTPLASGCSRTRSRPSSTCRATRCGRRCKRSQGEGFIELEPRRGARVAIVSAERALELFEVREVLEGLVASLAAGRRTDAEMAELRALVAEGLAAAGADDLAVLPALNTRFHTALADGRRQLDAGRDDRAPAPPDRVDLLATDRHARAAVVGGASSDRRCDRRPATPAPPSASPAPTSRWRATPISSCDRRAPDRRRQNPRTAPPSTRMTLPVTKLARALHRNVDDVGQLLRRCRAVPSGIARHVLGAHLVDRALLVLRACRLEAAECRRVELTGDDHVDRRLGRQLERQRSGGGGHTAAEHRAQRQLGCRLHDRAGGEVDHPAVARGR